MRDMLFGCNVISLTCGCKRSIVLFILTWETETGNKTGRCIKYYVHYTLVVQVRMSRVSDTIQNSSVARMLGRYVQVVASGSTERPFEGLEELA